MAHPRLAVETPRKAFTVGLTAALLALPMAGVSSAQIPLEGDTEDVTASSLLGAVDGTVEEGTDPVAEALAPVEEAVAPVIEVVEEVVGAPPAPAPAPETGPAPAPAPGDGGGTVGAAGGSPEAVSGGNASLASAPGEASATDGSAHAAGGSATATTPALRNELRSTGMRSGTEVNLQPFQPPIVSTPFSFQAPQVADEAYTTTPAPSVAQALQSASTDLPRHMPAGVPGALTATATGLLLLVGAGHLLHRTGYLRRSVIG